MVALGAERAEGRVRRLVDQRDPVEAPDIFKAIGDPVRWEMLMEIAAVAELPRAAIEQSRTLSKPTISHHLKLLQQAGLIDVRKRARNYYYCVRPEALASVVARLRALVPNGDDHPRGTNGDGGNVVRPIGLEEWRRRRSARDPARDGGDIVPTW